jgi:hypothetical protein
MMDLNTLPEELIHSVIESKSDLLNYVNERILKDSRALSLIGGENNIQVMLDNHRNHISFIGIVLKQTALTAAENPALGVSILP